MSEARVRREGPAAAGTLARGEGLRALLPVLLVALVCGSLVTTTAVILEPRQRANRDAERSAVVAQMAAGLPGLGELGERGELDFELLLIDLASGREVEGVDPLSYDARAAAQNAGTRVPIPPEQDSARLGARAPYASVYLLGPRERPMLVILPVSGTGYGGLLHGYLALTGDAQEVVAFSVLEHAETPGLGARIDDPAWRALWEGKRVRDAEGRVALRVARGRVAAGSPQAEHEVDAITGATRTTEALTGALAYWLGEHGFGPFLDRLRGEEEAR